MGSVNKSSIIYIMMFLLLITRPLVLTIKSSSALVLVFAIILYLMVLIQDKNFYRIATNKMIVLWPLLMFYHFFNAQYCEVPETDYTVFLNCAQTSMLLAFTAYAYVLDDNRCMKTLIWGFSIFLILCMFTSYADQRLDNRLASSGIHTNQIGQCAGVFSIITVLCYFKQKRKLLLIFPFILTISLLTQSRNSLGIILFSVLILFFDYLRSKRWYVSLFMMSIVATGAFILSDNLESLPIFQRFIENSSDDTVETFFANNDIESTNTILDNLLGERIIYYYLGWDDFIENPINGIGLWNFKNLHFGFPIHSEYIVHLAEGGLIGFIIYLLFIGNIVKGLVDVQINKNVRYQYCIAFSAILFVSITARIFMCEFVFPLYGCIIGYILKNNLFLKSEYEK